MKLLNRELWLIQPFFSVRPSKNTFRHSGTSQIWYIAQTTFTTSYRNCTKRQHAKIPLEYIPRNTKTKERQKMHERQLKPDSDSTATVSITTNSANAKCVLLLVFFFTRLLVSEENTRCHCFYSRDSLSRFVLFKMHTTLPFASCNRRWGTVQAVTGQEGPEGEWR